MNEKQGTEHTPGPWRIGDAGHTVFGPPNGQPVPAIVASKLTRANARLIAASPDLLAALVAMTKDARPIERGMFKGEVSLGQVKAEVYQAARAALDKATGGGK